MRRQQIQNTLHRFSMEGTNYHKVLNTPCFILDENELKRSFMGFKEALSANFQKSVIGYSVKTNSVPYCLNMAKEMGAFAEVVSYDEYKLALLCGIQKDHIIYNGPLKSKSTFLDAISSGAIVNIETKRELQWLKDLDKSKEFSVGLRLNINISQISLADADGNNDNSRFGFSDETDEFVNAVKSINGIPNVKLAGLHIHRTAHSRSVRFYRHSLRYACDVIKKYSLKLDYIDVGGGFYGIFPNKPTYRQYSDAFYNVLHEYGLQSLCVIVEPGNALVASCFSFLSEVIDVKHVESDLWFITTDGSRNDIDPFFRKTSYLNEEIYCNKTPIVKSQIIAGCSCLEYDRLFSLSNKPLLSIGDRILYHNVGAYTLCLTPLFIRYVPNIYLHTSKHEFILIREKWTANEYIQKSKIK